MYWFFSFLLKNIYFLIKVPKSENSQLLLTVYRCKAPCVLAIRIIQCYRNSRCESMIVRFIRKISFNYIRVLFFLSKFSQLAVVNCFWKKMVFVTSGSRRKPRESAGAGGWHQIWVILPSQIVWCASWAGNAAAWVGSCVSTHEL